MKRAALYVAAVFCMSVPGARAENQVPRTLPKKTMTEPSASQVTEKSPHDSSVEEMVVIAPEASSTAPVQSAPAAAAPAVPMAMIDIEWESVAEAQAYEVKLTPQKGGEALIFSVQESKLAQSIPAGTYRLQIRSKDKTSGYFGRWSPPSEIDLVSKTVELIDPPNSAIVANAKSRRAPVRFEWSSAENARVYTLRLWSDDPEKAIEFKTKATTKTLQLLSGRVYNWQVTFVTKSRIGYQADPPTFSFTLLGPQLVKPVVDENVGLPNVVRARWTSSTGAEYYQAKIFRRYLDESEFNEYKTIEKLDKNLWDFEKLPPGAYRIEVVAHASKRVSSEPGFYEFLVKPTEAELDAAINAAASLKPVGSAPPVALPAAPPEEANPSTPADANPSTRTEPKPSPPPESEGA